MPIVSFGFRTHAEQECDYSYHGEHYQICACEENKEENIVYWIEVLEEV